VEAVSTSAYAFLGALKSANVEAVSTSPSISTNRLLHMIAYTRIYAYILSWTVSTNRLSHIIYFRHMLDILYEYTRI